MPKVSAGHLRRDRTAVLPERARKIYAVCANPIRALEPPFDLIPPPVQCRRMLCASRNDDYSVASVPGRPSARPIALLPLLFAVLDLLVLLDQAKSTRKTEKGENFPIDSSGRIPRFRRCIRRPFSFPDFSQGGAMVRYAQRRLFVCVRTWQARGLPDCSEKESLRCMPKQTNGAGTRKSRPRLSETAVVTYQMPPDVGTAAERTSAEASSTSCGTVSTRTNCCTSPAAWLAVHVIALPDRLPIS